jgi:hypothetical protein
LALVVWEANPQRVRGSIASVKRARSASRVGIRPALGAVDAKVLAWGQHPKVLGAIVATDAVDVVNVIVRKRR